MDRYYVAVTVFGAVVGASELLGRYKEAPFTTLCTGAAAFYVAVNALAAFCAYAVMVKFNWTFGGETADQKAWIQAAVAGFGSMAFFRSALFTTKVGDADVSVGPGIFFQVLLFATDRACDRQRAQVRSDLIDEIMKGVSFSRARDTLPNVCFELMQNLPTTEAVRVRQAVDGLASSKMRDSEKVLNLGLMLMNVVGSSVVRSAVKQLGVRIQEPTRVEFDVFTKIQGVTFEKAYPVLVDVCFLMSKFGSDADQMKAKEIVIAEIDRVKDRADVDNDTKVLMLALSLQQRVGDGVLEAALTQLGASIKGNAGPLP